MAALGLYHRPAVSPFQNINLCVLLSNCQPFLFLPVKFDFRRRTAPQIDYRTPRKSSPPPVSKTTGESSHCSAEKRGAKGAIRALLAAGGGSKETWENWINIDLQVRGSHESAGRAGRLPYPGSRSPPWEGMRFQNFRLASSRNKVLGSLRRVLIGQNTRKTSPGDKVISRLLGPNWLRLRFLLRHTCAPVQIKFRVGLDVSPRRRRPP